MTTNEKIEERLKRIKGELENMVFGNYKSRFGHDIDKAIQNIEKADEWGLASHYLRDDTTVFYKNKTEEICTETPLLDLVKKGMVFVDANTIVFPKEICINVTQEVKE